MEQGKEKMMENERIEALIECLKGKRKEMLIERLKEEKVTAKNKWKNLGIIHGRREAYSLDYSQFKKVEKVQAIIHQERWEPDFELQQFLKQFKQIVGDEGGEQFNNLTEKRKDLPFSKADYIKGWLDGVTEIWNEIKGELDKI